MKVPWVDTFFDPDFAYPGDPRVTGRGVSNADLMCAALDGDGPAPEPSWAAPEPPAGMSLIEMYERLRNAAGGEEPMPEPPPPAPPPDPRSPIQQLLEEFDLEEDIEQRAQIAYWNQSEELRANQEAVAAAERAAQKAQAAGWTRGDENPGELPEQVARELDEAYSLDRERAPLAVDCDAQVHISASAIPFPRWHLNAEAHSKTPYEEELRVPILELPPPPRDERRKEMHKTPEGTVGCVQRARDIVFERVSREIKVRSKNDGGGAPKPGELAWVHYRPLGSEGWIYMEPAESEAGQRFRDALQKKYTAVRDQLQALASDQSPDAAKERTALRTRMRNAAACIAVAAQEGAPSAINTYDKRTLSWGIGIAAPGKLPETFAEIVKDPRVRKALYLCGFRFEGIFYGGQWHGAYQVVDLTGDRPAVVYRDNWQHKKGRKPMQDFEGHAYRVLRLVVSQVEMMLLLIQLGRDPMTWQTVFEPNYAMIERFVSYMGAEELHTEAVHVFAGQVKHNWGMATDVVTWAIDHFSSEEQKLFPRTKPREAAQTSPEKDFAIAKGIVRHLVSRLQRERWQGAIKMLKAGKKDFSFLTAETKTEYELQRLKDNYWKPLLTGELAQDGKGLKNVLGSRLTPFLELVPRAAIPLDHYRWREPSVASDYAYYDIGPRSQMDLIFDDDTTVTVKRFDAGRILIEENGMQRLMTVEGEPAD